MVICLDIDGVLCEDVWPSENREVRALPDSLALVEKVLSQGNFIVYYTSRPEHDRRKTSEWLSHSGFPTAPLFMGKPQADYYVDDRSVKSLQELISCLEGI